MGREGRTRVGEIETNSWAAMMSTDAEMAREGWVKSIAETLTPPATMDLAALGLQSQPSKAYKEWNCTHCYI